MCMSQNELRHYGVIGMKWGTHRARRTLMKSSDTAKRQKAVDSLNRHRQKVQKKIGKYDKKISRLESKRDKRSRTTDFRAARLNASAARLQRKSAKHKRKEFGLFTSAKSAEKHRYKSEKFASRAAYKKEKADKILAKSEKIKANLLKNQKYRELYDKGLRDIDSALILSGKKKLKKV